MRHTTLLSGIICLLCLLAACGDSHFMTDASYRSRVERDFQQKKALMPQGDLFAIFDTSLSDYEREALEFLYAYMPLADIADYSGALPGRLPMKCRGESVFPKIYSGILFFRCG